MRFSRRGFFGTIAVTFLAPYLPVPRPNTILDCIGDGTIGGIDRATYSFWRNRRISPTQFDDAYLEREIREAYVRVARFNRQQKSISRMM